MATKEKGVEFRGIPSDDLISKGRYYIRIVLSR